MIRFLLCGALFVAAAWSIGAAVAAAMLGSVDRLIGFAALALAMLTLSGILADAR